MLFMENDQGHLMANEIYRLLARFFLIRNEFFYFILVQDNKRGVKREKREKEDFLV